MSDAILLNYVAPSDISEIDALGAMEPEYRTAKSFVKKFDDRMSALRNRLSEGRPGEKAIIAEGEKFALDLAEATTKREVNIPELVKLIGPSAFLEICKVNIGDVEALVPEEKRHLVLHSNRGGSRSFKLRKREG